MPIIIPIFVSPARLVGYSRTSIGQGSLRLRRKGSAGGHNGLESVFARLETDAFARLRVGIGEAPPGRAVDYVLAAFTREEEEIIEEMVRRAAEAVLVWLDHGIEETMNRFNRPRTSPPG